MTSPHARARVATSVGRAFRILFATGSLAATAVGCSSDGISTLLVTRPEEAGANCAYGGLRLDTGADTNYDGVLSPDEVLSTAYVCNQRVDGRSTATRVLAVDPGPTCEAGGQRIETGIDDDDDRVLDDAEVDTSAVVCQGVDGVDGFTSRVRLVSIPSGIGGSACPFGGTRIESGPDTNRDGDLDDGEVDAFQSVCSVQVASSLFLVETTVENPGPNCAQGGSRMRFGFDDSGNGTLEPGELDGTPVYVCNQVILVEGKTSLTVQSAATTAQCTFGGYVYRSGLDDDYDDTLDAGEVDATAIVCNGANGYAALVTQTEAPSNVCNDAGGYRVRSGLDTDRDGVLDAGEVTSDNLLCNGGSVYGLDGRDSLLSQSYTSYTSYCGTCALVITSGLDEDRDGYLDAGEVDHTSYSCDAVDGANALVETDFVSGGVCYPSDGLRIRTGTDWNGNGYLDSSEYDESILCN
jgi:hypothetical protein